MGLHPRRLSVAPFSLRIEEFSLFDMKASSLFIYFSAFASTSAMLAWGFFEIENIRSFDCTPNLAMNAVMANFSSGKSIFRDSALNLCTYDFRLSCKPCLTINRW